jgi:hypothetical protein
MSISKSTSKPPFIKAAESTTDGYEAAIRHFNTFANANGLNSFETTKYRDVTEALFDKFCEYLYKATYTKDGEVTNYSIGAASQYLSGVFMKFKRKFSAHPLMSENINPKCNAPNWYLDIRRNFVKMMFDRIVERGEKVQTKSTRMTNEMLQRICDCLLKMNTDQSVNSRMHYVAAMQSCGRTLEASVASWKQSEWNFLENCLETDWSQVKVAAQKLLMFFNNYESIYQIDFFHAMACMWFIGAGTLEEGDEDYWMFPALVAANDPGREINTTLKSMVVGSTSCRRSSEHYVVGLTDDYSGTSFRNGCINTVLALPYCTMSHVVCLSGHDKKKLCAVFEYTEALPHMVVTAANVVNINPIENRRVK